MMVHKLSCHVLLDEDTCDYGVLFVQFSEVQVKCGIGKGIGEEHIQHI